MQELKIFIYEEDNKLFTKINNKKEEFKMPEPFWRGYEKKKEIEESKLLPFGKLIFNNIFCTDERLEKFEKLYKINEELIIQIISTSTLAHSIPFEIMAYKEAIFKELNIHIVRRDSDSTHITTPSKSIFKILFIISLPLNTYKKSPIDPLKEYIKIYQALGKYKDYVEIDILESSSYKNIRHEITTNSYDIIHFSGHGFEGGLVIEEDGDYEKERILKNGEIKELFRGVDTKVVILDACLTSASSKDRFFGTSVLKQFEKIPLVFGNQASISDSFATKEMGYIYSKIFEIKPYQLLQDVRSDASQEWWKSTLFIDGDLNTPLFEIGEKKLENRVHISLGYFNPQGKYIYRYEAVRRVLEELREKSFATLHGIGGAGKSYLADYIIEFSKGRYKYIIGVDLNSYKDREDVEIIRDITKEFYKAKVISKEKYKELKSEYDFEMAWEDLKECFDSEVFLVIDNIDLWLKDGVIEGKERVNFIKDITSIEFNGKVLFTSRENFSLDERGRKNFRDNLIEIETYSDNEFINLLREYGDREEIYNYLYENRGVFAEFDYHPLLLNKVIETKNIEGVFEDRDIKEVINFYLPYFEDSNLLKIALLKYPISKEFFEFLNERDSKISQVNSHLKILRDYESYFKLYKLIAIYGLSQQSKERIEKEKRELFELFKEFEAKHNTDLLNAVDIFEAFNFSNKRVGIYYRMLGRVFKNINFYLKAIEILKDEPLELATTYNNLASLFEDMGKYEEAKEYYFKALKIRKKELGLNHLDTATTYNNIAGLLESIGNYEEAKEYYFKALHIFEKELGRNHLSTATTYNNIAGLLESIGNYEEAKEYYFKALHIREKELGRNHPSTATTYSNIASLFEDMGKYEEAKEYYFKALDIFEKELGRNHPSTATTYSNIAGLLESIGNYEEAKEYYFKALKIREKELGLNHPSTATTYSNLALLFKNMGNYEEAKEYYFKALNIVEKELGLNHPSTATTYSNIASLFKAMGKYEEAKEYYFKALHIFEKELGRNHLSTATTYSNIASLLKDMGNYEDAKEFYFRALKIDEEVNGKNHPSTARRYNNIAGLFQDMGNYEEAKEYYFKALKIVEKELGLNHPYTATTYSNLAGLFRVMGNYEEAKEYLFKAFQSMINSQHYFEAYEYFIEYLKIKSEKEDISSEVCEAIGMLDNILHHYQNQEMFANALFTIEPIFEKANLNDNRCREKYKKYKEFIEQVKDYKLQNNQEIDRGENYLDGL